MGPHYECRRSYRHHGHPPFTQYISNGGYHVWSTVLGRWCAHGSGETTTKNGRANEAPRAYSVVIERHTGYEAIDAKMGFQESVDLAAETVFFCFNVYGYITKLWMPTLHRICGVTLLSRRYECRGVGDAQVRLRCPIQLTAVIHLVLPWR